MVVVVLCWAGTGVVSLQSFPMEWGTADGAARDAWRPAHDVGTTSALKAGDHVVVFDLPEVCGLKDLCGHVHRTADATSRVAVYVQTGNRLVVVGASNLLLLGRFADYDDFADYGGMGALAGAMS